LYELIFLTFAYHLLLPYLMQFIKVTTGIQMLLSGRLLIISFLFSTLVIMSGASVNALHTHLPDHSCCRDTKEIISDEPVFHRCGSTLYRELEESRFPEIRQYRKKLEILTAQWLEQQLKQSDQITETIIIPVVVHVVFNVNHPEQNISEEQIISQIEALNTDFRRLNSDTTNTPEIFRNIAADTHIEFRLARRTPDGLPTNGITRTATDVEAFSIETDHVKFDDTGGINIWNRDRYLNFWVCNLDSGYLGYAQYPGGQPSTDGIVISWRNFGTTGTAQYPFNEGRTVTHEVGHWLNLVHTWGDEDNCEATDYVADTPNQEKAYYHCPSFPQHSCESDDMFMNYMDYTDDRCMNIFTIGQSNRMHATLNGFRAPIKNSDAHTEPQFSDLWCDTLNKELKANQLFLYSASNGGYAAGTNAYNDKAKAQFYENTEEFNIVEGGSFAFGAAHYTNDVAWAALWETGSGRQPESAPIRKQLLNLNEIQNDILHSRLTHFSFDPPVAVEGSFFLGVILPETDTLALLASDFRDETYAWEQWEDNTWHNFKDSWNGTLNVDLAVFPLVCKQLPPYDSKQPVVMTLGPNPVNLNLVHLYITNYPPDEPINIEVYDITGRVILREEKSEIRYHIPLDISNIQNNGIFFIRIFNEQFQVTEKILRIISKNN
jgi:hypothetical protein